MMKIIGILASLLLFASLAQAAELVNEPRSFGWQERERRTGADGQELIQGEGSAAGDASADAAADAAGASTGDSGNSGEGCSR